VPDARSKAEITQKKLRTLHRQQHGVCGICKKPLKLADANLDHIVPRSLGGSSELWNLRATHERCNTARKNQPEDTPEYREALTMHRFTGGPMIEAYYYRKDGPRRL
jgi:5-methylcytosine-specific restriction endonuclease McrA